VKPVSRLFDHMVCVEVSCHARAYARPVVDPHGGEALFLTAPPTHTADVFAICRACDRAADEGHDHVAALGWVFDGREVGRLLDAAGIYARAMAPFLRGEEPLNTPHEVKLAVVRDSLVVRDDGGAFALMRLSEAAEGVTPVSIEAAPIAPTVRLVRGEKPS